MTCILLAIITAISIWSYQYMGRTRVPEVEVDIDNGISDLRSIDLKKNVGILGNKWEFYPDKLYKSEDFTNDIVKLRRMRDKKDDSVHFGTYRLSLRCKPNRYYCIAGYSLEYGTRVYVNGSEVSNIGYVADNKKEAIPGANYCMIPIYTGDDGFVELIYQYSNFVHNEGGEMPSIRVSNMSNMQEYRKSVFMPSYIISGGLLMLGAYYMLQVCLRRKKESVYLAMCCGVFAFRDQQFFIYGVLSSDYNWLIYYRIAVLMVCLMPVVVMLLFNTLYPKLINDLITKIWHALIFFSIIMMFILPTQKSVIVSYVCGFITFIYFIIFIVQLIKHFIKEKMDKLDILTVIGFGIIVLSYGVDAVFARNIPFVSRGGYARLGLVAFMVVMMAMLSFRAKEVEKALLESVEKENYLRKADNLKNDFLHNISHEIKTPLTVMSGYAQLTSWQLKEGTVKNDSIHNLETISDESNRLANLVSQTLAISLGENESYEKVCITIKEELEKCQLLLQPILEKNKNTIKINCNQNIKIYTNSDILTQIIINLVMNANKHTDKGYIILSVIEEENHIVFRVSDTGEGIAKEDIKHIFERGYSRDNSSGLGLAISKEAIEVTGGKIQLEETGEKGTTFVFTLPALREDENGKNTTNRR